MASRVPSKPPRPGQAGRGAGEILARSLTAVVGGYGLAGLVAVGLARWSNGPREEAVLFGATPAFLVWVIAVLCAFGIRRLGPAVASVLVPVFLLSVVEIWIQMFRHP